MQEHRNRRATRQWSKSGPLALRVVLGSPLDFVARLARTTSPRDTLRRANELPKTIKLCKLGPIRVYAKT